MLKGKLSKSLLAITALVIVLAVIKSKELKQLYHTTQLFKPEQIVGNFSNIAALINTETIQVQTPATQFDYELQPLPNSFDYFGNEYSIDTWLTESNSTALLVVKGDSIVHEAYYQQTSEFDQRISWSMAKSFLSALVGVAVYNGDIPDLDAKVIDYVPELVGSGYEKATIRHVLEMSSGVYFNEDYGDFFSDINRFGRVLALGGSFDDFAASLTSERDPGQKMHYVSIDTHVVGMVLRAATGQEIIDYFDQHLWSKLGAEKPATYVIDTQNQPMVLGGLNLITRDYGRFGVMFRDFGFYNNQQIIPKQWTIDSVKPNQEYLKPKKQGNREYLGYGYQWWVPYEADEEFLAVGIYGQFIYVNRKLDIVIVKNSADTHFMENNKESRIKAVEAFRGLAEHYANY